MGAVPNGPPRPMYVLQWSEATSTRLHVQGHVAIHHKINTRRNYASIYIVMYQDSNGQKYAGDVYGNVADAEEARERAESCASAWVVQRDLWKDE